LYAERGLRLYAERGLRLYAERGLRLYAERGLRLYAERAGWAAPLMSSSMGFAHRFPLYFATPPTRPARQPASVVLAMGEPGTANANDVHPATRARPRRP